MTAIYIQMFVALIFVILVIADVGFLMKKKQSRSSLVSIVSYYSMGPQKGVAALKTVPVHYYRTKSSRQY